MDPARSETPASDALTGDERDARIEQLLLTGLDCYFANDYDQAINLWTRVLFLDRHHDRARAYIERARSAQAEVQREGEALMHQGLDAFNKGDVEAARQLVADALARGASRDLALGVLDRIERLGVAPAPAPPIKTRRSWLSKPLKTRQAALEPTARRSWTGPLLLIVAGLGFTAVGVWGVTLPDVGAWIRANDAERAAPPVAARLEPLPLPGATELYLSRGRALYASGRLRDALRELDHVPIGDPERAAADRLRAQVQRELLAVAAAEPRPMNEVP